MRDHRKLKVFHAADALALETYRCTRSFPREETFGLIGQMRRAAVSVPSNIVEGCARKTAKDYLRFLHDAYASAMELEYQASLARRLGYLADASLEKRAKAVARMLNALIKSLQEKEDAGEQGLKAEA